MVNLLGLASHALFIRPSLDSASLCFGLENGREKVTCHDALHTVAGLGRPEGAAPATYCGYQNLLEAYSFLSIICVVLLICRS